ncbi:MAG: thioredoxin [Lachnospiraceae bacterium]|nr:thioredoxin [Lachnospiraceae bacterium]MCR4946053.1 thioredoxin [Lachnospiraceae bacterium]
MSVTMLTTENFDDVVMKNDKPVLIDFYADWCGPCKMVSPLVDKLAEEHPEYTFCKVNVDEASDLALKYGVMNIPTLVTMNKGVFVEKSVGAVPEAKILDLLKTAEQK